MLGGTVECSFLVPSLLGLKSTIKMSLNFLVYHVPPLHCLYSPHPCCFAFFEFCFLFFFGCELRWPKSMRWTILGGRCNPLQIGCQLLVCSFLVAWPFIGELAAHFLPGHGMGSAIPDNTTIQIWIGNASTVNHLKKIRQNDDSRIHVPMMLDSLSHLRWLWGQVNPCCKKIAWIKVHHNSNTPFEHLPCSNPPFFPSSHFIVSINGQHLTGDAFSCTWYTIQVFLSENLHRVFANAVGESIVMEGHAMAYTLLTLLKCMAISKMMHHVWLNTGTQRPKITMNASSNCPQCRQSSKMQEHILCCKGPRMRKERYNAGTLLKSTIVTKLGSSAIGAVLFQVIQNCWMVRTKYNHGILTNAAGNGCCKDFHIKLSRNKTPLAGSMCFAYMDSGTRPQAPQAPKSTEAGICHQWLTQFIKELWTFSTSMWNTRNGILHDNAADSQSILESALDSQIW